MADSPSLLPLEQSPLASLVGYVAAYYLPQADLLEEPVLAGPGLISQNLQLLDRAGWRPLPHTPNTLKLEETPKSERGITTYQVRVTAQRPQPVPDVLNALAGLDRRPLLLLVVEAGGGRRLLGSLEEYVLLLTTGEGQSPANRSGLELRLEGEARQRAPYYTGDVPLLGGGSLPAPSTGAAGYVRIVDKRGNLMAQVPAGTTVTVASGFKVVLSY